VCYKGREGAVLQQDMTGLPYHGTHPPTATGEARTKVPLIGGVLSHIKAMKSINKKLVTTT
jgi:hypothetical protein